MVKIIARSPFASNRKRVLRAAEGEERDKGKGALSDGEYAVQSKRERTNESNKLPPPSIPFVPYILGW